MRPERYNAKEAEPKWQKVWNERELFRTTNDDPRPKYYVLEMFPYPSGRIHMGHVRNYTMGDVVARYKRATGFTVLHPMGWDAFGMPAENAAMERKVHPGAWTRQNIAAMKAQLQSMGLSLDWAREIATCDPSYYKHQQRMFLEFFKISDYAEELLAALDTLDRWPEKVRLMQKNWIGRSEGLLVRFALDPKTTPGGESELEIFTT